MATLVRKVSAEKLEEQERKDARSKLPPKKPNKFIDNLAQHVMAKFEKAKRGTDEEHAKFIEDKRQRLGKFDPRVVAAQKELFGAEYEPVYMMITETKCRAFEAWVKEIILSPSADPFDLAPTPIPELPPIAMQIAQQKVFEGLQRAAMEHAQMTGMPVTPEMVMLEMQRLQPAIEELSEREVRKQARKAADNMKEKISDQFREGYWHSSFEESLFDLATYGTAIMKGPVNRMVIRRWRDFDPMIGQFTAKVENKIIPVFERVNPMDFFPGPNNSNVDDGYICHRIYFSRKDLSDLIGVEGFDQDAIRRLLDKNEPAGVISTETQMDGDRRELEGKNDYITEEDKFECIEFWGTASGKLLKDFGIKDGVIDDDQKEYFAAAWVCGDETIKAMINPNPLGLVPFSKCNFVEDPDNFWGRGGIPRLIRHVQLIANMAARGITLNVAVASGPQIEINVDRMAPGASGKLWPFKVWKTTNAGMAEGKAVNFYAPPMVTERLIAVYNFCSALADEDSGIPKYAHGEGDAGGAGKTASGLSMLMTSASRGIKAVVKNIDNGIIKPTVQKMYDYNIDFEDLDIDLLGDITVVPKGSTSLIAKEQQAVRRNEFLANTNNPTDIQILGLKGRKELLRETADSLELDLDKIFDEEEEIMRMAGMTAEQMASPANPTQTRTDAAGNPVQGKDYQLEERGE